MGKMKDRLIEDMSLHPESYSEDASEYMSEEELRVAMGEQSETRQDRMRDEHITPLMKEALAKEEKE